jgi:hypothetical protein
MKQLLATKRAMNEPKITELTKLGYGGISGHVGRGILIYDVGPQVYAASR